ncbi:MAG: lipase family protein [Rhodospirillales bacterium]|nr:lipase family protein [Acetobacter sp.]
MKYTFSPGFDLPRALQLANLVNCAYNQFLNPSAWTLPAGFVALTPVLSAKEYWKFGPLSEMIETHLGAPFPPTPFGFTGTVGTDVFVVIRGTKTPLEWFDDFSAEPTLFQPGGQPWGKVGRGYSRIFADLGPQILQALGAYQAGGGSLANVYVTGHSLGAALAHLAAAAIAQHFGVRPVSYTFSGPRAGDSVFAAKSQAAGLQTWRIFNTEDIVPTVPPAAVQMATQNMGMHGMTPLTQALSSLVKLTTIGYQHVGHPVAATFHYDVVADNHSMDALCDELQAA